MELKRKKFQGVLNILSFNRHFYVYGFIALAVIITIFLIFNWSNLLLGILVLGFLYGLLMPLVVSAYVYDFSGYYDFKWLNKLNLTDSVNTKILNINAGFDETSFIIKNHFPKSDLQVFDFYNEEKHTEPAIIRARKVSLVYPNTQEIISNSFSQKEKIEFLKECHRVCKSDANIVMIEHLRDFPNFMAFTIGFTHFFSKRTWRNAFKSAGFKTFTEQKFTPFMSIFNSQP